VAWTVQGDRCCGFELVTNPVTPDLKITRSRLKYVFDFNSGIWDTSRTTYDEHLVSRLIFLIEVLLTQVGNSLEKLDYTVIVDLSGFGFTQIRHVPFFKSRHISQFVHVINFTDCYCWAKLGI